MKLENSVVIVTGGASGLGLAFVKQAIENMGGIIYFTTEINIGTTFHIILPLVN